MGVLFIWDLGRRECVRVHSCAWQCVCLCMCVYVRARACVSTYITLPCTQSHTLDRQVAFCGGYARNTTCVCVTLHSPCFVRNPNMADAAIAAQLAVLERTTAYISPVNHVRVTALPLLRMHSYLNVVAPVEVVGVASRLLARFDDNLIKPPLILIVIYNSRLDQESNRCPLLRFDGPVRAELHALLSVVCAIPLRFCLCLYLQTMARHGGLRGCACVLRRN